MHRFFHPLLFLLARSTADDRPANLTLNPAAELVPALMLSYLVDAEKVARNAAVRAGNRLANALKVALQPPHSTAAQN